MNFFRLILLALSIHLLLPKPALSQEKSVAPGINKMFEEPELQKILGIFEAESREIYAKRNEIVAACKIEPGMAVADIGACTGLFTRLFASAVGPKGKVYAVDIAPRLIEHITASCKKEGLENVVGVVSNQHSVNLPPNSIDLAFICDTYHHFEFPLRTMQSLHQALRPGGRVIVIDFHRIPGKSREWVLGHVRAGQEVFTREIRASGFKQIEERHDLLEENYFLRFEKTAQASVSKGKRDQDGFIVHEVSSPYQKNATQILVLTPDKLDSTKRHPVVYVLPVEPGAGTRWGHGLREIKKLDLHNKLGVIFVMPTFSDFPWYCDHPTDPHLRQETYFVEVVVPFIEGTYPVAAGRSGRLLLGFSKSGWGAFTLLLRHPDLFERAAAWDAPLNMTAASNFGMGPIFGTQPNFEKYQVSALLTRQADKLKHGKRLALVGYSNFRPHHQAIHEQMKQLGIPHEYQDVRQGEHHWNSGWLNDAVRSLLAERTR